LIRCPSYTLLESPGPKAIWVRLPPPPPFDSLVLHRRAVRGSLMAGASQSWLGRESKGSSLRVRRPPQVGIHVLRLNPALALSFDPCGQVPGGFAPQRVRPCRAHTKKPQALGPGASCHRVIAGWNYFGMMLLRPEVPTSVSTS
jgi:hypothetical protein